MHAELGQHVAIRRAQPRPHVIGRVVEERRVVAHVHVAEMVVMPWVHDAGRDIVEFGHRLAPLGAAVYAVHFLTSPPTPFHAPRASDFASTRAGLVGGGKFIRAPSRAENPN